MTASKTPSVHRGDRIQIGVELMGGSGRILWGTVQTVKMLYSDGRPIYRAKWGKVDKIANRWRLPPAALKEPK